MRYLRLRLTEGKQQASIPEDIGSNGHTAIVNKTVDILPITLFHAAWAIRKNCIDPQFRDISDALLELICPVCSGNRVVGNPQSISCPACSGTGWKDGQDPTWLD
jgi:hypothetical protein